MFTLLISRVQTLLQLFNCAMFLATVPGASNLNIELHVL